MTASERRKIMCSVTFHIIAITCVVWSLYVLIDRTTEEIKQGQATGTSQGVAQGLGEPMGLGLSVTPGFIPSFWKGHELEGKRHPVVMRSCCERFLRPEERRSWGEKISMN